MTCNVSVFKEILQQTLQIDLLMTCNDSVFKEILQQTL